MHTAERFGIARQPVVSKLHCTMAGSLVLNGDRLRECGSRINHGDGMDRKLGSIGQFDFPRTNEID